MGWKLVRSGIRLSAPVLLSVQKFEIPSLGVTRHVWGACAPGLWIHVVSLRGIGQNESLIPALSFGRPHEARRSVGLSVGGRCRVRVAERGSPIECVEGDVAVFPGRASFRSTVDASEETTLSLHVETHATESLRAAAPSFGRLGDLAALRQGVTNLADAIERAWEGTSSQDLVEAALAPLFERLRAEGVPVPAREAWRGAAFSPQIQRCGRAVDMALSQTDARPMMVDVERFGRISSRTVERAFPTLCEAWGQRAESFHAYRQRACLVRACGAMANARATTEGVARALGFSSPNAFCRTMARAGLPSPGAVRRVSRDLA